MLNGEQIDLLVVYMQGKREDHLEMEKTVFLHCYTLHFIRKVHHIHGSGSMDFESKKIYHPKLDTFQFQ